MNTYNYITVLSNWLLGYDKYSGLYKKTNIKNSTYPNDFYLLKDFELEIGLNKAKKLLDKLSILNNKIIRIETIIEEGVEKNTKNGLGWIIHKDNIKVSKLYEYLNGEWLEKTIEDITAMSYLLNSDDFKSYQELKPRTLSYLPIAIACQAKCKFCFSETSISAEQKKHKVDLITLEKYCELAKKNGATRFVITGGGEPGLLNKEDLLNVIRLAKKYFNQITMISNGLFLSKLETTELKNLLLELSSAGLSVLSISYHSHNVSKNINIMGIDTKIKLLLNNIKLFKINFKIRLVCVLQKSGISNNLDIQNYLDFAIENNIEEVCFKELYISSTFESIYAKSQENKYSIDNQVYLNNLIDYCNDLKLNKINELPWGSPIYRYVKDTKKVDIAAYTEPSVGWEKTNGIARSWNVLSNGKCYASLEDKNSEIL